MAYYEQPADYMRKTPRSLDRALSTYLCSAYDPRTMETEEARARRIAIARRLLGRVNNAA